MEPVAVAGPEMGGATLLTAERTSVSSQLADMVSSEQRDEKKTILGVAWRWLT